MVSIAADDDVSALALTCRNELDRHGFVVVPGFLTDAEVAAGRESFARLAPTPEVLLAEGKERFALLDDHPPPGSFGGQGVRQWPFYEDDVLVDQLTSPKLVSLVKQILGVDALRLGEIALTLFAKYASLGNDYDQVMHMDRIGLLAPQVRGPRRQIRCWVYYSDIDQNSGPTCLVPLEYTKDLPVSVMSLDRDEHSDLYEHEVAAVGPAGTLLMWTNPGTFHRGSALGPSPAYRWLIGSDFQAPGLDWMGGALSRVEALRHGSARPWMKGPEGVVQRFFSRATPEQRALFGFPEPGDPYWDERTIAATADEYPGMDMTPYRASL
jgi:hypothetical protein